MTDVSRALAVVLFAVATASFGTAGHAGETTPAADADWRALGDRDGFPRAAISAGATDQRTGDVWVGTWGGGLVRSTAGRFDRFTQFNSGLAGDLIFDVTVVGGRIWVATNAGVSSYEPTTNNWGLYLDPAEGQPQIAVTGFRPAPDGLYAETWAGPPLLYDPARDEWARVGEHERDRSEAWSELPESADLPGSAASPAAAEVEPTSVPIGILGPLARPISRPGGSSTATVDTVDRTAVVRAVDRANRRVGGGERRPFALAQELHTFETYGWGTAQDSYAVLRDRHDARGFIGFIEPHACLDTAVALRTEVPVVNVAATEPTIDETDNPWVFRCGGNDPRRQRMVLDHVLDLPGPMRLALLFTPGHETRAHLDRWDGHARSRGHEPLATIDFDPQVDDLTPVVDRLRDTRATVLLTWSDTPTSAAVLRGLRAAGWGGLFVGGDRIVTGEFVDLAGANPGRVLAPGRCRHYDLNGDDAPDGHDELRTRLRASPAPVSPHARRSFDAAMHLLAAIEIAGPERVAIRDTLSEMRTATLARLEDGAWVVSALETP
jgi:ABC-type branched-subunit amino acid transport system substrate-binding protein